VKKWNGANQLCTVQSRLINLLTRKKINLIIRYLVITFILISVLLLLSCLSSKEIELFECTYGQNGGQSLS
jgi:hypothetical protein